MKRNLWLTMLIVLALIAAACAGEGVAPQIFDVPQATDTTESSATPQENAVGAPSATPAATATGEALEGAPEANTEPEATAAALPTEAPAAVAYTSDGNPCVRPLAGSIALSGAGLPPLNVGTGEPGEGVIAMMPRPGLDSARFAPAFGSRLLVLHSDPFAEDRGAITLLDLQSGAEVVLSPGEDRYYALALSEEAPMLAAMSGAGQVLLWNLEDARSDNGVPAVFADRIGSVALSPDGGLVAVSRTETDGVFSSWGTAVVYDARTGQEVQRMVGEIFEEEASDEDGSPQQRMRNGHGAPVTWLGFSPDGQALLTVSSGTLGRDGTMRLWDVQTGEQLRCFEIGGYGQTGGVAFSPDGREIATASGKNVLIWDTATSVVGRRFDLLDILGVESETVAYSADGSRLISTSEGEQAAYVWDSTDGRLLGLLRHPNFVRNADLGEGMAVAVLGDLFDPASAEAWLWDAEHPSVGLAAAAQVAVVEGLQRGREGDVETMLLALDEARNLSPDDQVLLRPSIWDLACRFGSFAGQAAAVLAACDTAVQEAGDQALGSDTVAKFRDSRGIARALSGDFAGAIDDFQFYIEMFPFDLRETEPRQAWINSLQNGVNPFDQATLDALQEQ